MAACSQPDPGFGLGSDSYKAGDTIKISNSSKGAERYEWYVNEKQVSTEKDLTYVPDAGIAGVFTITLKIYDGDKSAQTTKTVQVTSPLGTITAWSTFAGVEIFKISDGKAELLGITTGGFDEDPGCGAASAVSISLAPGTYTIDGASDITRSRRIAEVYEGSCISLKMH